ncbi:immune inhibitor A [Vibrio chagasii]|nr:immune inhibitor A [Vibrio chagasii]
MAGQAAGWYRASKPASFYGGNSPTTDNDLNAQELVPRSPQPVSSRPSINLADYDIEDQLRLRWYGGDFRSQARRSN